jgi:hypothetical protein
MKKGYKTHIIKKCRYNYDEKESGEESVLLFF